VGHRHGEAGFIGEALQFAFPQADPGAVAAAAVGGDDEAAGFGIARATEPLPPAADALDGEGGGVVVDAEIGRGSKSGVFALHWRAETAGL
jgi:hypothetical protein